MKHVLLFLMLCIGAGASAQLGPGDLAFTAFNADADDDFTLVTFVDIPANTTIYFTDSEWDGSAFGTDEGDFAWDTGSNLIPQGTVITFNTTGNIPSVSVGSIVGNTIALSASSEAVFAFLGTAPRTPTVFLAALANAAGAYGTLNNTGLVEGFSAITFPNGSDIADYTGPRTGLDRDGYLLALNDMTNYDIQDGAGDQSNDGTVPDLPFDTTPFVVSTADLSPPSAVDATVVDINTVEVTFSEEITTLTAEDLNNYSFNPTLNISNITYDAVSNTATITHNGFNVGTAYVLTVIDIEDLAGNIQTTPFVSNDLFFNDLSSGLIITEIMYNAPGAGNDLEFVEIFNNTSNSISLGGLIFSDSNSFSFVMPEQTLNAGDILLLANNKTAADAFYGVSFIDLGLGGSNAFGNGGEELKINNSTGQLIFSVTYDDAAPWPTQADGNGPSIELLDPNGNFNDGANWVDATNLVGQSLGVDIFASPGVYTPATVTTPNIQFTQTTTQAVENVGSITLDIEISEATTDIVTFDVVVSSGFATAAASDDFTFTTQNLSFPANSTTPISITIPIIDDTDIESDELFSVEITNANNASIGSNSRSTIYILDNDNIPPTASNALGINYLTSYLVDAAGSAEVVAHDPVTERLFVVNSTANKLEIVDISDLNNINTITSLDLTPFGAGPNSVAVHNGLVALAMESGTAGVNGQVVFFDTNGANPNTVTVGDLPDMLTFTPDGTKVLVANEGEPNDAYTVDPEGTVSIIDVTPGLGNITQANVIEVNFNAFDADITTLRAAGVRIFGPGASVSQDLEPEYITVSDDSQTAWISLQENNALATLDIATATITAITPLGLKDHSLPGNSLDASNTLGFIFMGNWPVKGMYMPDAIAHYSVGGVNYVVTANEGDARDYDGFSEEVRAGNTGLPLDNAIFTDIDFLKNNNNLGRINSTTGTGDLNNDGLFEEIHVYGARSFSIWNMNTQTMVYDSGDLMERITAADPVFGSLFNASNANNTFKNRSDDKGPEPEGVIIQEINGEYYAFIALERIGGIMTFNITDPNNPTFENYSNSRDINTFAGDQGAETLVYIAPEDNANNTGLIVVANEVSSTLSFFTIDNNTLSIPDLISENTVKLYPNPVNSGGVVEFTSKISGSLYDLNGREIMNFKDTNHINLPQLKPGLYLVRSATGETQKLVVR